MSPLWRDEVVIYLSPRKLALARRSRGLRPRVGASTELAVSDGGGEFAAALACLADVLREPLWHDASACVVIAGAWVRFGIVPAPAMHLDGDARRAHARYVLTDTFGDIVSEWQVALEDVPPGQPSVVCAMPAELRSGLESTLAPARLRLRSVQPQPIVAFNAWRRRIPADDAWFVTLEDGWLCAVHLAHGTWDRVHTARLSSDGAGIELERMQAFGRMGAGSGRMFIEAPPWMRERLERSGSGPEWLEAQQGDPGMAYELGLLLRAPA